jgi:hypothetical protein
MPKQKIGIKITDLGNGLCNIQWNGNGTEVETATLFDSEPSTKQIVDNLRLAFLIGGFTQMNSEEFKKDRRVHCKDGSYWINSIELVEESQKLYHVTFSKTKGHTKVGMEISQYDLMYEENDTSVMIANIAVFLKKSGYTTLTAKAIEAVEKKAFWW